jgi:hypothetical protein
MPGQNPYSPYLPANNPSLFAEADNESGLSNLTGLVGAGLGLFTGGPAGALKGYQMGSAVGGIFDADDTKGKMQSAQQLMSGVKSTDWFKEQSAKSAAANILSNMGGTSAGS